MASIDWAKTTAIRDEKHLIFGICCTLYYILTIDGLTIQQYVEVRSRNRKHGNVNQSPTLTIDCDVIMSAMASQITGVSIVCSIHCSGADQRKHQCPASQAFVTGIQRWLADFHHNGPVTRKIIAFGDVIIEKNVHNMQLITFEYTVHTVPNTAVIYLLFIDRCE